MANEPADVIVPMLREIRTGIGKMHGEIGGVKQQLHKLNVGQKAFATR